MNTLSVGQSLTSYGNEFAVCMVSKTNEQITYTIVGMNNPALTDVPEVSLRFYRLAEKKYSVKEVRDRHAVVKSEIENREAEKSAAQEKRRIAEQKEKHDPANAELLTVEHESNTTKLAAKNIRTLLKKHFRGIKFSVRMRDYNAIYVSWDDGPTKEAVDELIGHFQEGRFDGMQDMYEFNDSVFNRVFGGVMYLFTERSLSDELVTEAIAQLRNRFGETAVPDTTTAESFRKGLLWNHSYQSFHNGLQSEIHKQAAKIDKTK